MSQTNNKEAVIGHTSQNWQPELGGSIGVHYFGRGARLWCIWNHPKGCDWLLSPRWALWCGCKTSQKWEQYFSPDIINYLLLPWLEYASESERRSLMQEIDMMKDIGYHRNVVCMLACCTHGSMIALVMEFMPCGNLQSFLKKHRNPEMQVM